MDFAKAKQAIRQCETISYRGKIDKVIGLTVEAVGLMAGIGEICKIYTVDGGYILSEVVGFRNDRAILIPYDNLCSVAPGSYVEAVKNVLEINVGSQLQGRILDGLGTPIDGLGDIENTVKYSVNGTPINPLARPRVTEPIYMGIKAIDSLLTCAKGQRMGIFSGSGVGKSTLLGMIAQNVQADINVIALIGERGREVKEFIEKDLGPEGMKRSVVVVATSDQPAMVRHLEKRTGSATCSIE